MCFWEHLLFLNLCKIQQGLLQQLRAAFDSLDAGTGIFLAAGASESPGQFSP